MMPSAISILLEALEAAGVNVFLVAQFWSTFEQVFIRLVEEMTDRSPP
jgi:hypothetical protein